jgi:hypothetical protein
VGMQGGAQILLLLLLLLLLQIPQDVELPS